VEDSGSESDGGLGDDDVFHVASSLFQQEANWAKLIAEARELINEADEASPRYSDCLLKTIAHAKGIYRGSAVLQCEAERVPPELVQSEAVCIDEVTQEVSRLLSEAKPLPYDTQIMTDRSVRKNNRQTKIRLIVDEIKNHVAPKMVSLIKLCLVSHYRDNKLSATGLSQLARLLASFSTVCDSIQPKRYGPQISFKDPFRKMRVAVRILSSVYNKAHYQLEEQRRREQFRRTQREERTTWEKKIKCQSQVAPTPVVVLDDKCEEDEQAANETANEGEGEPGSGRSLSATEGTWADGEGNALVEGLQKYQGIYPPCIFLRHLKARKVCRVLMIPLCLGPDRYAMIVRDYRKELTGRTMEDIVKKAREIKYWYVAAMERNGQRTLDPQEWNWLLSV
jgi:hypothetical protein